MIRALRPEDLDQVMQIWLDANLEAHCFLPESYWCDHMEEVRAALPAAQVFVYQDWEGLQGFAGLTGDYLAILTLGFGEIIRITLNNIDDVLGFKLFYGAKGLKNIPKYSNFTNVFLCVVITCFLIHAMMKSRHGRAVLAIRDNEIAAESCGIQTTYYKVMAFAFSAAFAGLAGGLYACYLGVLDPSTFGFMKSIEILVMVVLGGMGSMLGSILSATVLTILPEATRSFESYRMVVYSLVLILMMIFRPGGLLGSYDFSMSRIVEKAMNGELFRKKEKEGADHE